MTDLGDRMAAENTALESREARLDELIIVFGIDAVREMFDGDLLTEAQAAEFIDQFLGERPKL